MMPTGLKLMTVALIPVLERHHPSSENKHVMERTVEPLIHRINFLTL
jgi:hypothetical protein